MAGVLRTGVARLIPNRTLLSKAIAKQLPSIQHASGISSKALRDLRGVKRPPPYDYMKRGYSFIDSLFDRTSKRIDENSKIILVEGPIAAGKTKFAQELAKELDMHYMPHANMDMAFINSYGFDLRTLDDQLPPKARTFDEKNFLADPKHRLVALLQVHLYKLKFYQYVEALAHLFSTGQGVILDRSCYSDIVFVESLFRNELISRNAHRAIHEIRENSIVELLKPHLVIYLDVPVDVVHKRIKERNIDNEANSPLFKDTKFLTSMEKVYKQEFLQDISTHAEILVYDWTNGGETELIVEDIERIDFDRFEKDDSKIKDWRFMPQESDWAENRMKFTQEKHDLFCLMDIPITHAPELMIEPDDSKARDDVWDYAPGMKYAYGYNEDMGDKGIWWKTKKFYTDRNTYN